MIGQKLITADEESKEEEAVKSADQVELDSGQVDGDDRRAALDEAEAAERASGTITPEPS